MTSDPPTSVAFVGGVGRSGSTLVEQAVAAARGVCALGEVVHLWQRGVLDDESCSCGRPFSQCPFWTAVGRHAFGGWRREDAIRMIDLRNRVDRTRYVPAALLSGHRSPRAAQMRQYGGAYGRIYAAAAEIAGARLVVDSSKHPSTAAVLRCTPGVDLRIVHVVRDSRAVAYSWTTWKRRPQATSGLVYMDRWPAWKSALTWDVLNLALAAVERAGVPVMRIRYEDFVAAPAERLAELFGFLRLDRAEVGGVVDGATLHVRGGHEISGNPDRSAGGTLSLRPDDRWRRQLPQSRRWLVTTLTLPLMVRYGYPIGRRAA